MLAQQAAADAPAVHGSFIHNPGAHLKLDILLSQAVRPEESGPQSTTTHSRETTYDAIPAASMCRKDSTDLQQQFGVAGIARSSSVSTPMQYNALLQQGLEGNVAAVAAMHYKQQQIVVSSSTMGPCITASLATLPGLQEHQNVEAHRIISSTAPSAATTVYSYLGSPKAKTTPTTAARLPAALPGVSSLYGRLRSSALGPGAAGTGAAAAAAAVIAATDASNGSSPQAGAGAVIDGRCQVLSSPHLWPSASAALGGNHATAQLQAAAGDSSAEYLSLLMAATGLSAADTPGAANSIAADGPVLDAQQQLHLLQQLQQLHGSQPGVSQSSNVTGHTVSTVAGLPPTTPGLMLQQLPAVQQQQLLLAGLGNCGPAVAISQEQLKLLNQGDVAGGLVYPKPAGLQLAGLQQVPPGATPNLALSGGAHGLTSALAALKVEHALAGLPGSTNKADGAHNPLYKTELCRTWQETGSCRYGARCQFAHGQVELRAVVRPPKYKTQPCRTYSLTGKCPYGARCNFIHDGEVDDAAAPRPRADSTAAAAVDAPVRVSNNGGPASINSASGVYFAGNTAPGMDPAVAAGLLGGGGVPNGAIDAARLNSMSSWSGVLPSDESYSSNMSAISLGTGNAGLAAMSGLAGLANGIHVGSADGSAGVNFATGNGVIGLNQLPAGLVAVNGGAGGVAALAQYGLLQNIGNAQMGLSGFTGDRYSQMLS